MAVSISGADFTVTVGAVDYSGQITTGTATQTSTITRTRTLGPDDSFTQTDLIGAVTLSFLYDEEAGLYAALEGKAVDGTSVALVITGADGTWTGSTVYVESVDVTFDATGVATCTTSFTGQLAFA